MAVVSKTTIPQAPAFVTRLVTALENQIPDAHVDFEPLNDTGWYRFIVISPAFDGIGFLEGQDRVWAVAEYALSAEERRLVSMIVTATPDEVQE